MRLTPFVAACCLAALHSAVAQVPLPTTGPRAALAGVVRDTLGRPLPFVTVSADGRDISTVTDSSGRFHLGGIPAGRNSFTVMRIGYKAISFETTLPRDSTILIDIRMRSAQALPEVQVSAKPQSARLMRDGFYERQRVGWGKYLAPEEVDSLSRHVSTPAQLLRNVSGVRLRCGDPRQRGALLGGCTVTGANDACMALFIDGVFTRGQLDENLGVSAVYALEVYNRPVIVPVEFKHPATARCGAILVWTQSRRP